MSSRKKTCACCGMKGASKKVNGRYYHKECWEDIIANKI